MADVAAVGSVLIPAARRSGQNPGGAVALLAASAVMAETIPPCINLIILGFVTNLSISGLFMAGLLPAGLMALVLVAAVILFGRRVVRVEAARPEVPIGRLWGGAAVTLGLGLYGTCLIGEVPVEAAVKPMLGYLGLLLVTLMVIAFVPAITLWLPHAFGY